MTLIEPMAQQLQDYLSSAERSEVSGWVASPDPLPREVTVKPRTWMNWLQPESPSGHAASKMPKATPGGLARLGWAREVVVGVQPVIDGKGKVTRSHLHQCASALGDEGDRRLIAVWVTTMMWGSGNTNGRGPWRLRQSLLDERLPTVLRTTASLAASGQLIDAYDAFSVHGVGPSFFTKWLWASTLAAEPARRPLILDQRVLATLALLSGSTRQSSPGGAAYEDYVDLTHAMATLLAPHFPGIDAEKIEWLLFSRGKDGCAQCLRDWLHSRDRSTASG